MGCLLYFGLRHVNFLKLYQLIWAAEIWAYTLTAHRVAGVIWPRSKQLRSYRYDLQNNTMPMTLLNLILKGMAPGTLIGLKRTTPKTHPWLNYGCFTLMNLIVGARGRRASSSNYQGGISHAFTLWRGSQRSGVTGSVILGASERWEPSHKLKAWRMPPCYFD